MPTETYYKLLIEGPPRELLHFRADDGAWNVEPWSGFFGGATLREDAADSERLVYLWADDYKRPGPNVDKIAALHPQLRMLLEWSDEFGSVAKRVRYLDGKKGGRVGGGPYALEWMEWQQEAE